MASQARCLFWDVLTDQTIRKVVCCAPCDAGQVQALVQIICPRSQGCIPSKKGWFSVWCPFNANQQRGTLKSRHTHSCIFCWIFVAQCAEGTAAIRNHVLVPHGVIDQAWSPKKVSEVPFSTYLRVSWSQAIGLSWDVCFMSKGAAPADGRLPPARKLSWCVCVCVCEKLNCGSPRIISFLLVSQKRFSEGPIPRWSRSGSAEDHQFSTRSLAERKLWLRAAGQEASFLDRGRGSSMVGSLDVRTLTFANSWVFH